MTDKMQVVMPGDSIEISLTHGDEKKIIIGPGLRRQGQTIYASKAGILVKKGLIYYIDNFQRRYIPVRGEAVVGVVVQKTGDVFKVDIGASEYASLSYLSFEGASKRNRPDVQIGDAVFAKLITAGKDMESELVCVDSHGKKGKLGILGGDRGRGEAQGMLFNCSLNLIRKILNPNSPLFSIVAKEQQQGEQPYEIAVGMNGKIWINANSSRDCIALANTMLASEFTCSRANEIQTLCQSISQTVIDNT